MSSLKLFGYADDTFDLTLVLNKNDGTVHSVLYREEQITEGAVAWVSLDNTDTINLEGAVAWGNMDNTYIMEVDDNNDGVVDRIVLPASVDIHQTVTRVYLPTIVKP